VIIAGIVFCVLAAGFFAGMETGLIAANHMVIYQQKEKGRWGARCAYFLLQKPDRLLATTLIGTNAAVVTATILMLILLRGWNVPSLVEWAGVFGLTLVVLVFAEIVPKSFFRTFADSATLRCAPFLAVCYVIFLPLGLSLNALINVLLFVLGRHRRVKKLPRSREDLRLLLRLRSRELALPPEDQRLIDDLFAFPETKAREVMIPVNRSPLCPVEMPPAEAVTLAAETSARFLPVYVRRSDNIIGYVDIEDLLCAPPPGLRPVMREAVFYPETKRIPGLLLEMNQRDLDLVFLCDEYGLISGLITRAEIISDIAGTGEEGTAGEDAGQAGAPSNRFIVPGMMNIDDFSERTGIVLEKGGYDTVGGYLCEKTGEIPKVGAEFNAGTAIFRVLERDKKQVKKVEVIRMETEE
jgi:putative hemolysin